MKQEPQRNVRSLAKIAREIHSLERRNIFAIGRLLIEAKARCNHGEWEHWLLDSDFEFSWQTANNFMGVARVADKFPTVRKLKVPYRVLYRLDGIDEAVKSKVIGALAKASRNQRLTEAEAEAVMAAAGYEHPERERPSRVVRDPQSELQHQTSKWCKNVGAANRIGAKIEDLLRAHPDVPFHPSREFVLSVDSAADFMTRLRDRTLYFTGWGDEGAPSMVPMQDGDPMPADLVAALDTIAEYARTSTRFALNEQEAARAQAVIGFLGDMLRNTRTPMKLIA